MKTFKITIEEHISETFEIEANDIDEAMEKAKEKYNDGEFVLEPRQRNCQAFDGRRW